MLLSNWLGQLSSGLRKLGNRGGGRLSADTRPRRRRDTLGSTVPAVIEVLEPRRVMSAVSAVDDSFVVQPTETPSPVVLDVLSNDLSAMGNLSFSAVGSVMHGSVAIQPADPSGYGGSSTPTLNTVRHSGCWRGRISSLCGTFFAQHRA